jgi:hypothetical protein
MSDRSDIARWAGPIAVFVLPTALAIVFLPAKRMAQLDAQHLADASLADSFPHFSADQAEKQSNLGSRVADEYVRIQHEIYSASEADTARFDDEIKKLSRAECRLLRSNFDGNFDPTLSDILQIIRHCCQRAASLQEEDLDAALEMLLTARRIEAQLNAGRFVSSMSTYWRDQQERQEVTARTAKPLVDWATAPGQTPQRIKRAIEKLAQFDRRESAPTTAIMNDFLRARAVVRGDAPPKFVQYQWRWEDWLPFIANRVPGEAQRAEKALEIMAAVAVNYTLAAENTLNILDQAAKTQQRRSTELAALWRMGMRDAVERDFKTTVISTVESFFNARSARLIQRRISALHAAESSYLAADEFRIYAWLPANVAQWVADVAWRRGERVRLALIAYRLENGAYPASLDALVPAYLTSLDIYDPFAGSPFGYRPEGFPQWLGPNEFYSRRAVPPYTPVIWSIGAAAATFQEGNAWVEYDPDGNPLDVVFDVNRETTGEIRPEKILTFQRTEYGAQGHFWMQLPKEEE